jgi:hypothetical protein
MDYQAYVCLKRDGICENENKTPLEEGDFCEDATSIQKVEECKERYMSKCPRCSVPAPEPKPARRQLDDTSQSCYPSAVFNPADAKEYFELGSSPLSEYYAETNTDCFYNEASNGRTIGTEAQEDTTMVNAQDQQNHIYGLGQQYLEFTRAVRGLFSYHAIQESVGVAKGYFGFPPSAPLSTSGNPNHHGIIAAQLFDEQTQYKWAQQMKGQFPMMALVTSPEVAHGMRSKDYDTNTECQYNINKYLLGDGGFDGQPEDGLFCYTPERRKLL